MVISFLLIISRIPGLSRDTSGIFYIPIVSEDRLLSLIVKSLVSVQLSHPSSWDTEKQGHLAMLQNSDWTKILII